jgi:hypothetical protein
MSGRTWSVAAVLAFAIAMPVAPMAATAASASTGSRVVAASHGNDDPAGDDAGKHKQKGKKAHAKFNLGGGITAVDAAAGTVTFRVHGGKFKALRKTELTVTVADGARVRRNGAVVTLADLVVGDHVRVKGVRGTDGVWTANRVTAEARDNQAEPGDDNGGTTPEPGDDSGGGTPA